MPEIAGLRLHAEDPALFREAIAFTAAETRFAPRLIEKDYFCSALLGYLAGAGAGLILRGGTCLAKVHADFYRLSEDLDFLIPMPVEASRAERSAAARAAKRAVAGVSDALPGLRVSKPLRGANDCRQYVAAIGYESFVSPTAETVKIEVGLREPLLTRPVRAEARTLLLDPISGEPLVPPLRLQCLAPREVMAEKLRAALSRRAAAIRDFYDIDHAVRRQGLRLEDRALARLVGKKLAVPGNAAVDASEARLAALRQQVQAELRPVLRDADFTEFDLERAFALVVQLARRVGREK